MRHVYLHHAAVAASLGSSSHICTPSLGRPRWRQSGGSDHCDRSYGIRPTSCPTRGRSPLNLRISLAKSELLALHSIPKRPLNSLTLTFFHEFVPASARCLDQQTSVSSTFRLGSSHSMPLRLSASELSISSIAYSWSNESNHFNTPLSSITCWSSSYCYVSMQPATSSASLTL